ncbi:MAG: ribonuclease [Lachnospiraceae bacterium]|nr:ribonuclease [Lachnospiraceae bacterium]
MAGKNKNYKKQSIIKAVIFFIIAAAVLIYMRKDSGGNPDPTQHESTSSYIEQYTTSAPPETTAAETKATQAGTTVSETKATQAETTAAVTTSPAETDASVTVTEDGEYSDKEHVALYIHTYEKLPSNYISKTKAKKQGWEATKGNLWDVLPGMSIGGGPFENNEGILPEKEGRSYKECDIDYDGGGRNAKRIVFSNDGLIYYTEDHYNTFELLYGEP